MQLIIQAEVQSTLITKDAWSKLEDGKNENLSSIYTVHNSIFSVSVGSSPLNSLIAQSSRNSGAAVSNIWSPRKRSSKLLKAKNNPTESQIPTMDAFQIVPYPALDSQLLQIIFSPKTLLEKMAKDVKDANDASILVDKPKKMAHNDLERQDSDNAAQDMNIFETPKIVAEELTVGKPSETPTKYNEFIKTVDMEPTVVDIVENIEIPKNILIEELKIVPTHNERAQVTTETRISSEENELDSILSPILNAEDEISASDLQPSTKVTANEEVLESSVIVGTPSNLLINESSEIIKKLSEMSDASVTVDDCDECHECDNIASEAVDLEMASNEDSTIQYEHVADPIFEEETVAKVVPAPRRPRGPQALPTVINTEPTNTEKQDAIEKYKKPTNEEPISLFANKKPIDLKFDEKSIETLAVPKTSSGLEVKIDQEIRESMETASNPITSSAEEKDIEQEFDEIEESEIPKISPAEERQIDKEVDELLSDKALVPKISSDPVAFSIIEPTLFSKNVKRQIGNDMRTYDFVRPAVVNKPMFKNNLENETSSEKRERIQKGIQRLMHFVAIVGHVDSYLSKRFRNSVRTFARFCDSGEDMRLRHPRSRFSSLN